MTYQLVNNARIHSRTAQRWCDELQGWLDAWLDELHDLACKAAAAAGLYGWMRLDGFDGKYTQKRWIVDDISIYDDDFYRKIYFTSYYIIKR